jgi:hypothetical protein
MMPMTDWLDDIPRYTQAQVLAVLPGVTRVMLQNWANRGLLALAERNPGTARRRLYSARDIAMLAAMHRLTLVGVTSGIAARIADGAVAARVDQLRAEWASAPGAGGRGGAMYARITAGNGEPVVAILDLDGLTAQARRDGLSAEPAVHIHIDIDDLILWAFDRLLAVVVEVLTAAEDDAGDADADDDDADDEGEPS